MHDWAEPPESSIVSQPIRIDDSILKKLSNLQYSLTFVLVIHIVVRLRTSYIAIDGFFKYLNASSNRLVLRPAAEMVTWERP